MDEEEEVEEEEGGDQLSKERNVSTDCIGKVKPTKAVVSRPARLHHPPAWGPAPPLTNNAPLRMLT